VLAFKPPRSAGTMEKGEGEHDQEGDIMVPRHEVESLRRAFDDPHHLETFFSKGAMAAWLALFGLLAVGGLIAL
jgi:hypothetical protein